jgi:hypothetical protein
LFSEAVRCTRDRCAASGYSTLARLQRTCFHGPGEILSLLSDPPPRVGAEHNTCRPVATNGWQEQGTEQNCRVVFTSLFCGRLLRCGRPGTTVHSSKIEDRSYFLRDNENHYARTLNCVTHYSVIGDVHLHVSLISGDTPYKHSSLIMLKN